MADNEQELRELDKLLCEFIDPDIPYEEQSAPLLDASWSYGQKILAKLKAMGYVKWDREKVARAWFYNGVDWEESLKVADQLKEILAGDTDVTKIRDN